MSTAGEVGSTARELGAHLTPQGLGQFLLVAVVLVAGGFLYWLQSEHQTKLLDQLAPALDSMATQTTLLLDIHEGFQRSNEAQLDRGEKQGKISEDIARAADALESAAASMALLVEHAEHIADETRRQAGAVEDLNP